MFTTKLIASLYLILVRFGLLVGFVAFAGIFAIGVIELFTGLRLWAVCRG